MSRGVKELRILIAEDLELVRRGIRSLLEDQPSWKICGEAATGAETIEQAQALVPDILLLDVTMPDVDGEKTIPRIVECCPAIRILALATRDSPELAAAALAAGANGLALKFENGGDLIRAIKTIERGHSYISPAAMSIIRTQLARPKSPGPLPTGLTPREMEILGSLAKGHSNQELAEALGISVKTVNAHRSNIMRKLGLHSYRDLIQFAVRHGAAG